MIVLFDESCASTTEAGAQLLVRKKVGEFGFMLTVPEFANGAWAILDRGQAMRVIFAIGSSSDASAELFDESCVSTTEAGAQLAISKNGESFDFLLTDPQLPNSVLATLSRDQTLRLITEIWRDFDADAL